MASLARLLRPDKLDAYPGSSAAELKYRHWKETFKNYLAVETESLQDLSESTKLKILLNNIAPNVYSFIRESNNYADALRLLDKIYIKSQNEIHARYMLISSKQKHDESIADYLHKLQQLAFECNFKSVSAEQSRDEYVRDTFIAGLHSTKIQQRLLTKLSMTLEQTINQALTLEMAEHDSKDITHTHNTHTYSMSIDHLECNESDNPTATPPTQRRHFPQPKDDII